MSSEGGDRSLLTIVANPIRSHRMLHPQETSHRSPDRPSPELHTWEADRLIVPDVVIPVMTPDPFTPAVTALQVAQGIVAGVIAKSALPPVLEESTLFTVYRVALRARYGEPCAEGFPVLTGPRQTSWQLVQVAEQLLRRDMERSVIESAMEDALR
jgi:hypothetical protein